MSRYKLERPEANQVNDWVDRTIKWTSELEAHLSNGDILKFDRRHITPGLFRPFVAKQCYYSPIVTHRRYQMPQIFPHDISSNNRIISFCVNHKDFYVLAADRIVDLHFTGDTQCLPLYRYTDTSEQDQQYHGMGAAAVPRALRRRLHHRRRHLSRIPTRHCTTRRTGRGTP